MLTQSCIFFNNVYRNRVHSNVFGAPKTPNLPSSNASPARPACCLSNFMMKNWSAATYPSDVAAATWECACTMPFHKCTFESLEQYLLDAIVRAARISLPFTRTLRSLHRFDPSIQAGKQAVRSVTIATAPLIDRGSTGSSPLRGSSGDL